MIWNFIGVFDPIDPPDDVLWPHQPLGESGFRLLSGEQVVGSWDVSGSFVERVDSDGASEITVAVRGNGRLVLTDRRVVVVHEASGSDVVGTQASGKPAWRHEGVPALGHVPLGALVAFASNSDPIGSEHTVALAIDDHVSDAPGLIRRTHITVLMADRSSAHDCVTQLVRTAARCRLVDPDFDEVQGEARERWRGATAMTVEGDPEAFYISLLASQELSLATLTALHANGTGGSSAGWTLMHVIRPGQSTGGATPDVSTTRKNRIEMVAADGRVEKVPLSLLVMLRPDGSEILYIGQSGGQMLVTEARVIFHYAVVPHKINKNGWGARPEIDVPWSSDQMFAGHLWLAQIVEMRVDAGSKTSAVPQMFIIAEDRVRNPSVKMVVQLACRSSSDLLTAANALLTGTVRARGLVPSPPFVRVDEQQSRGFDQLGSDAWSGPAVWVGSPEWTAAMGSTSTSASPAAMAAPSVPVTSVPMTSVPAPPAGPAPLPPPTSVRPAPAPPPPPLPVQLPPAQWSPDPFGRYQLRYWDGAIWTEHVSTNGVAATDPPA